MADYDPGAPPYPNPTTAAQVSANRAWFDQSVRDEQAQRADSMFDPVTGSPRVPVEVHELPPIEVKSPPWGLIIIGAVLYWLAFVDARRE